MAQTIVADAAALGDDLKNAGHVAVEGIYFDTGKAVVKPESARRSARSRSCSRATRSWSCTWSGTPTPWGAWTPT